MEDPLFDDDPAWSIDMASGLRSLARGQLGTVGAGNHYVDVFADEVDRVWIGVHFAPRGLGHRLATHFMRLGGGSDDFHAPPVLFDADSRWGGEYRACMELAGRYAYAGRDWVCRRVCEILGSPVGSRFTITTTSPGSRTTTAAGYGSCARAPPPPSPGCAASSAAPWETSP